MNTVIGNTARRGHKEGNDAVKMMWHGDCSGQAETAVTLQLQHCTLSTRSVWPWALPSQLWQPAHITVWFQKLQGSEDLWDVCLAGQVSQFYCDTNPRHLLASDRWWDLLYSHWSRNRMGSRFFFYCIIILHGPLKVNFIYWLAVIRFSAEMCLKLEKR